MQQQRHCKPGLTSGKALLPPTLLLQVQTHPPGDRSQAATADKLCPQIHTLARSKALISPALFVGEQRRLRRIKRRGLSEPARASLPRLPPGPSSAAHPARHAPGDEPGSPFFGLLFFGETKKSKARPARARRARWGASGNGGYLCIWEPSAAPAVLRSVPVADGLVRL